MAYFKARVGGSGGSGIKKIWTGTVREYATDRVIPVKIYGIKTLII